jgi:hypothetical protein
MNNTQGGYRIIDFKGIDLADLETLNTNIYKAIEESYKSKALLLTNIVIDEVEYNAVFKEIKHIDNYYEFELYGYHIVVSPDKITSKKVNSIITLYNYNISLNDIANIYVINSEDTNVVKARFHLNIYQQVSRVWTEPILRNLFPIVGTVTIEYDYNNNHYIAIGSISSLDQLNFSGSYYNQLRISDFNNGVINTTTMEYETNVIPWGSQHPTQSSITKNVFYLSTFEKTKYKNIVINI